ncbi:hypothetical protein HCN44_005421 [Aphidius gifuensis]|uniref:Neurotransmitter-gated ion-channel ligand-binding domain-containing protein n=1 Tax=Aphidius gifuensis TaxID=684658 RepID=A0A835CVE3_APHGI|nr:hypothetical protein HCN44_005421 [Aphidius gifuensis]
MTQQLKIRPSLSRGKPVVVDFTLFVVDINSINVEDMDFRIDHFICQSWTESRLIITDVIFEKDDDYVILPLEFYEKLWQPDPYFLNSKIETLTHKFSSVMLFKNKTALDLWMAGCMIFVFTSLGEFIVVKVMDLRCQQSVNYQRHLTARLSCMERNPI